MVTGAGASGLAGEREPAASDAGVRRAVPAAASG